MTQNDLATINPADAGIAAEAATKGDLAALSPEQRTQLYGATCRSMGLNPLSQPFQYIRLNNKLTLYATRTATDQLRKINGVSITGIEQHESDGVLTVTIHARDKTGREDMEIGAVSIAGLKGENLANAHMKAITKAKRRVTLSISGLGWLDETEVDAIPNVTHIATANVHGEVIDHETGEIGPTSSASDRETAARDLQTWISSHGYELDDAALASEELSKGQYPTLVSLDAKGLRDLRKALDKAHGKNANELRRWIDGLRQKAGAVEYPPEELTQPELTTAGTPDYTN